MKNKIWCRNCGRLIQKNSDLWIKPKEIYTNKVNPIVIINHYCKSCAGDLGFLKKLEIPEDIQEGSE